METPKIVSAPREFPQSTSIKYSASSNSLVEIREESKHVEKEGDSEKDSQLSLIIEYAERTVVSSAAEFKEPQSMTFAGKQQSTSSLNRKTPTVAMNTSSKAGIKPGSKSPSRFFVKPKTEEVDKFKALQSK